MTILPLYTEDLSYDILYTENVYLALPPGHQLIEQAKAHADDGEFPFHLLDNEKFILLKPEMTLRQLSNQILNDYNVVPEVMMETVVSRMRFVSSMKVSQSHLSLRVLKI